MKKIYIFSLLLIPFALFAQPKPGYYNATVGKVDAQLKSQLYDIIKGHTDKGYDGLYTIYATSDVTADGKVWDMYSTCTWTPGQKQCGNYSDVCDCYNREHTIPQSWFSKKSPMVSDAFQVYPTDGKVNGQRSNYPYGECNGGTTLNNGKGRLGGCSFPGYSGTVFEPDDEFKGDLARTYFYFATRYENIMNSIGGESFNNTVYPAFPSWTQNLFLKWHRQDPVSEKETVRNNAIEKHQKNRNPFIDYPMLAEHIWGSKKGEPWSFTSGINEISIEFTVSPNPVKDILNIKSDEPNLKMTIYNLNGQILLQDELNGRTSISTTQFDNGMYLIQLSTDTRKTIQKFIVNQ